MYELIKRAKSGEKKAFDELLLKYKSDLYKVARAKLSNVEDIAEVFQETACSAYKYINKLKEEKYFKTWITRILINKCNNHYKKKKYVKEVSFKEIESLTVVDDYYGDSEFGNIIESLKSEEKLILTLYYGQKYTTKEIAKMLKTNENTIKTKIRRAKKKLEEMKEKNKEDVEVWTN